MEILPRILRWHRAAEGCKYAKITFKRGYCIGIGGDGTRVYRRSGGSRSSVAVKRILADNEVLAKDVENFTHLEEESVNVIRCYQTEEDVDFWYIVLQLATCTVEVMLDSAYKYPNTAINISILRQAANGLEWLHNRTCRSTMPTLWTLMAGRRVDHDGRIRVPEGTLRIRGLQVW